MRRKSTMRSGSRLVGATLALTLSALTVAAAPASPIHLRDINRVATQTAKKIAKLQVHKVLITQLEGCLNAPELCGELETALRAELAKAVPEIKFIERDEAMKHLAKHGFMSIDAYLGALDLVASEAGAEMVVGEEFLRKGSDCDLRAIITDSKHLYALGDVVSGISCSAAAAPTVASLLQDPHTGVSLVVNVPRTPDLPQGESHVQAPVCAAKKDCPFPIYSSYAWTRGIQGPVRLLVTITEQGMVRNARVLGSIEPSLTRVSLDAVQKWHFKPATGPTDNRSSLAFP